MILHLNENSYKKKMNALFDFSRPGAVLFNAGCNNQVFSPNP